MRCAALMVGASILAVFEGGCGTVENYTLEETAALAGQRRLGRVCIAVKDAVTGRPIAQCNYVALKFSTDESAVDRRPAIMVGGPKRPESAEGKHEFELVQGWYRLLLSADGYKAAWTPEFDVLEARTTSAAAEMMQAYKLRVTVLESDGSPCAAGTLLLQGADTKATLGIKNGLGETLFDEDELQVIIDPRFMPGYNYQALDVSLQYGTQNEIVITLQKA